MSLDNHLYIIWNVPVSQAGSLCRRIVYGPCTPQRSQPLVLYGDKAYHMPMPHAERAVVDIRKLRDYCLNPMHDEGQHKARLFAAALGMTAEDAEDLRALLIQAVKTSDAQVGRRDA